METVGNGERRRTVFQGLCEAWKNTVTLAMDRVFGVFFHALHRPAVSTAGAWGRVVGIVGWRGLWKTARIGFGGGVAIGVSTLRGCWVRSAAPAVPAVQCALRDGARVALQEVDEAFGRRCAFRWKGGGA